MYRAVACLVCALIYGNANNIEVNIKQGKLLGTRTQTIFDRKLYYAFYGIPYAQPPIGKLRFKDPKPPKKWILPLDARTEFHGACAQAHVVHRKGLYGMEDCLRLNIFSPTIPKSGSQQKAVILWIHGYAFTSSFSHIYGPDFFIDKEVIFITATHRISVFGFLKLNETDTHANMGLKDIVMALKWIRKNVKFFNGDRDNVTVMGSGSAATFLSLLLTTKHSRLFSKMILQSGSMFSSSLMQGDRLLEKSRLESKLKVKGYKSILSAPANDIVAVANKIYTNVETINSQRPLIPFLPIIEKISNKSLLTSHPYEYLQKSHRPRKLILIGFNTQESISEVILFLRDPHYLKLLAANFRFMVPFSGGCKHKQMSQIYYEVADKIKKEYFKKGISEKYIDSLLKYASDLIKYPIYHFIQTYLQIGNRMFAYKFNFNGNLNAVKATSVTGVKFKVSGAASGDEICYLLRCEPISQNYIKVDRDKTKDRSFILQITELWTNFAKFGNPTPSTYKGNVTWPPITQNDDNVLYLNKVIELVDSKPEQRMYQFWNEIYRNYYQYCNEHDEL